MNEHVGNCMYHFTLPRRAANLVHHYAASQDVGTGEGGFPCGTPGFHEWEATSGAVKWWPRWGARGKASLFADFYLQWDETMVEVCVDVFDPRDEPECPWYHLPPDTRVAMARLAFWQMCAQAAASALKVEIGHRSSLTAGEMERLIEPSLPLTLADLLARAVHEAGAAEVELHEVVAGSGATGHRDNLAASKVARQRELERMTDEELDEIVHDLKAEEASEINNAGREDQIAYILEMEP